MRGPSHSPQSRICVCHPASTEYGRPDSWQCRSGDWWSMLQPPCSMDPPRLPLSWELKIQMARAQGIHNSTHSHAPVVALGKWAVSVGDWEMGMRRRVPAARGNSDVQDARRIMQYMIHLTSDGLVFQYTNNISSPSVLSHHTFISHFAFFHLHTVISSGSHITTFLSVADSGHA